MDRMDLVTQALNQDDPEIEQVVVVSAFSGQTDDLIGNEKKGIKGRVNEILEAEGSPDFGVDDFEEFTEPNLDYALAMARKYLPEGYITNNLELVLDGLNHSTLAEILAIMRKPKLSPGEKLMLEDRIMALGEVFSAHVLSEVANVAARTASGKNGHSVRKYRVVDSADFFVIPENLNPDKLPKRGDVCKLITPKLAEAIQETLAAGYTPIVPGYSGYVEGGLLKKFGRGYTDAQAALAIRALLALGLNPEDIQLQIIKEVEALMSADPSIVGNKAKPRNRVLPSEARELATLGGMKAVHELVAPILAGKKVSVRVMDINNLDSQGTLIAEPQPGEELEEGVLFIAKKSGQTMITVEWDFDDRPGINKEIFTILDELGISSDATTTSENSISFSVGVNQEMVHKLMQKLQSLTYETDEGETLPKFTKVNKKSNRALICLVGRNMENIVGLLSRITTVAKDAGVSIDFTSGHSDRNETLIVREEDADKLLKALHTEFAERDISEKKAQ